MLFHILQYITLSYSALAMLLVVVLFVYEGGAGFSYHHGRNKLCEHLSQLPGRDLVLGLLRVYSIVFILAWIAFVLPFVNPWVNGPAWISAFADNGHFESYLGEWPDLHFEFYWLMTYVVTALGASGSIIVWRLARDARKMADSSSRKLAGAFR